MNSININNTNISLENKGKNTMFENDEDMNSDVNIFRYKFTPDVMNELTSFAKVHQYDDRKTYKESWVEWVESNNILIRLEVERLTNLGYQGDVIEKMYKAARYYFRKKTKKNEPVKRRKYISIDTDALDAMDAHIRANIKREGYKPSIGYSDFCESNIEVIRDEVAKLCFGKLSVDEIIEKIKKTYKNRYFIISRNVQQHTD